MILYAVVIACTPGCSSPSADVDAFAREAGMVRTLMSGTEFRHMIYAKPGVGDRLHVYIEHDGMPWIRDTLVARDPTPREPLMMRMMADDPAPAVYLGRPCYFGLSDDLNCDDSVWTSARYSERVVASMAAALRKTSAWQHAGEITLFGYSGGGTIAVLLAERALKARAVVTLAANLDVKGWSAYHRYTPLDASLDPAARAPLPATIVQWHYFGALDDNVPAALAANYVASHPQAQIAVVDGFNHRCCWQRAWPDVLAGLEWALTQRDRMAPPALSVPCAKSAARCP